MIVLEATLRDQVSRYNSSWREHESVYKILIIIHSLGDETFHPNPQTSISWCDRGEVRPQSFEIYPLGIMIACTKFHGYVFNSCWAISVLGRVINWPTSKWTLTAFPSLEPRMAKNQKESSRKLFGHAEKCTEGNCVAPQEKTNTLVHGTFLLFTNTCIQIQMFTA